MKNNKITTIKCEFDLCEEVYHPIEKYLSEEKQNWEDYIERLILKDYTQLQKENPKKK